MRKCYLIAHLAKNSYCFVCWEAHCLASVLVVDFLLNLNYHLVIAHLIVIVVKIVRLVVTTLSLLLPYYWLNLIVYYNCLYYSTYYNSFVIEMVVDCNLLCSRHMVRNHCYFVLILFVNDLRHRYSLQSNCKTSIIIIKCFVTVVDEMNNI